MKFSNSVYSPPMAPVISLHSKKEPSKPISVNLCEKSHVKTNSCGGVELSSSVVKNGASALRKCF